VVLPPASAAPVYVDAAIQRWRGRSWCHLFSEDIGTLHAFAARLGMRREWFQEPPAASWPHYDLTAERRAAAVALGAIEADRRTTVTVARRIRASLPVQRP